MLQTEIRKSLLRAGLATALVAAATAAAPAPAPAAQWSPLIALPGHDAVSGDASAALDPDGRLTSTSVQVVSQVPPATRVVATTHGRGEQVVTTSDGMTIPTSTTLAIGSDGTAVVCIVALHGPDPATAPQRFLAAVREPGAASFGAPQVLATAERVSPSANACAVDVGRDGRAAIALQRALAPTAQNVDDRRVIDLFTRPAGGGWSAADTLSPTARDADEHSVAVGDDGDVDVVWLERFSGGTTAAADDDRRAVKLRHRASATGVVGAAIDLWGAEDGTRTAVRTELAAGPGGRTVVAWQSRIGGGSGMWASMRPASGTTWDPAVELLADPATHANPTDVRIAPDGTTYLGYALLGAAVADDRAGVIRHLPGSGWTGGRTLSNGQLASAVVRIGLAGNDALLLLLGLPGGEPTDPIALQSVRWPAGAAAPGAPVDVASPAAGRHRPALAFDGAGTFAAVVHDAAGAHHAVLDERGPALVSLDLPATAVAGEPAPLHARFADVWSGAGPTTWELGDGTTATGGDVTHAWRAPGTYAVTVRGSDGAGNATARTATVTVAPARGGGQPPQPPEPPRVDPPRPPLARAPRITLTPPACARRLKRRACARKRGTTAAWRTLRGTVAGGSGAVRVEVAVARKAKRGGRLVVLSGRAFRPASRAVFERTTTRALRRGATWSLKLPRLAPGTYLLRIRAVDAAGTSSSLVTTTLRLR